MLFYILYSFFFFFFQAEDGIRDPLVTGVQTCALPIYSLLPARPVSVLSVVTTSSDVQNEGTPIFQAAGWIEPRSEERRVGKSVDLGGGRIIKKKKEE